MKYHEKSWIDSWKANPASSRTFCTWPAHERVLRKYGITRDCNKVVSRITENKCGRFAVITTSGLPWKDLLIQYRLRNGAEFDFSQLQSDLFVGVCGKSDQDSAEGGLLVNFLSLRLRITLIERLKETSLADKMWFPDVINLLKKLKMLCIGGNWRLNEVTKAQRELFKQLGIKLP